MSRRAAAESARQTTNVMLGVLTVIVLGLLGWQIATQVQVSRVAWLQNVTFTNMTVSTFQSIQNVSSTASSLFVASSGIDNTTGAFFITTILNGQTSYSGATIATFGIYYAFTTTFVGDDATPAYIVIDIANLHGLVLELAPAPFNFVQLPLFSVGAMDGLIPQQAYLISGPAFPYVPVSNTQLAILLVPSNTAPAQRYTSQYLEFGIGAYLPFTVAT